MPSPGYVFVGFAHGTPMDFSGYSEWVQTKDPYTDGFGYTYPGRVTLTHYGNHGIQAWPQAPADGSSAATSLFPALPAPFEYGGGAANLVLVAQITDRSWTGDATGPQEVEWNLLNYRAPSGLADLPSNGVWYGYDPSTLPSYGIPYSSRAELGGSDSVVLPNLAPTPDETMETGLYAYSPHGWNSAYGSQTYDGWYFEPMGESDGISGVTWGGIGTFPLWTKRTTWVVRAYVYAEVYGPDGSHYPPPPTSGNADLTGLCMDLTPLGGVRQVYCQGNDSDILRLRSRDDDGAFVDSVLPFTGRCPDLLCLPDGRMWVWAESSGSIVGHSSDDDGSTWT